MEPHVTSASLMTSVVSVCCSFPTCDDLYASLQTVLPSTSATGNDKGLVSILRPEQSTCTWYLASVDVKPVQSVAIPLSYSERGNLPVFDSLLL